MRKIIINKEDILVDSGLFFGKGAFETILVKEKAIFLEEHIDRLNNAIDYLGLGEKVESKLIENIIEVEDYHNIAIKVVVTEKNMIITTRDIKYNEKTYKEGFSIKISNVLRNSTSNICRYKTLNYLENIIEYEKANSEGFNEAIFFNEKNNLSEGCTTNIFIVKNNAIYTPTIDCGILNGVLRKWVINNFSVISKEISKEEFLECDEIFLTNSLVGIVKVSTLENRVFKESVSNRVKEKYDQLVNGGDY